MEPGARSRKSPSALVDFHLDNKIRELMSAIEHELVWHASRNPDNISGRKFLTGATLNGAVALLMRRDWSEEDFRRQLSNARITRLSGPKGAKGAAIEFVEGGDLVSAIYSACADAFRRERRVVEDIEVFCPQLNSPALRDRDILRDLHIPVGGARQTENILADIAERAKNRRVVAACSRRRTAGGDSGRLKGGPIEPADAVYSGTACV